MGVRIALAAGFVASGLFAAPPVSGAQEDVRADFEATMDEITRDLPDLIVTSKTRTDADQVRLAELGYTPHPHSQHKLGLAWDCVAPAETLGTLRERAAAAGLVALAMRSPVTGSSYVHVQRYARTPAIDLAAPRVLLARRDPLSPAPVVAVATTLAPREPVIERPRPIGAAGFDFPRRLLRKKVDGRIVLLLELSEEGEVLDVEIDSSDLPAFEDFVAEQVRRWRFTPARLDGRPTATYARFPIPIRIQ
jgi:protein TonB